jgi:hypothetical protein
VCEKAIVTFFPHLIDLELKIKTSVTEMSNLLPVESHATDWVASSLELGYNSANGNY